VGRNKKILVWGVVAGAAAAAAWFVSEPPTPAQRETATAAVNTGEAKPAARGITLPSREGLSRPRGDLFAAPPVRVAPKPEPKLEPPLVVAPPAPPPMPYRVAGQVVHEGPPRIVLARDDRVFFVAEGDTLEGGYRVESIRSDGVTLVYTALDLRQHLPAASALALGSAPGVAAAKPAPLPPAGGQGRPVQLRWDGPSSVQAGSEFEVALKMTSDRPVRGSPLQLSYDAKLLEPVAVRAGEFFAEGSFTYRVNPGSIFVGAFGRGDVPADAEFVVVTFKPIRPGATAELILSSLVLQGSSGALVHEPLAAFRTAISK
jgi:Cohesin domain